MKHLAPDEVAAAAPGRVAWVQEQDCELSERLQLFPLHDASLSDLKCHLPPLLGKVVRAKKENFEAEQWQGSSGLMCIGHLGNGLVTLWGLGCRD